MSVTITIEGDERQKVEGEPQAPNATFAAHVLATWMQFPQTRVFARSDPENAIRAYSGTGNKRDA